MADHDGHPVERPPAEAVADARQRHEHGRPQRDVPGGDVATDDEAARGLAALGEEVPAGAEDAGEEEQPADPQQRGAPEPEPGHERQRAGGVQDPRPVRHPHAPDGDAERPGKELVERAEDGGGEHAEREHVGDGEEARREEVARRRVRPRRPPVRPRPRGARGAPRRSARRSARRGRMRRPRDGEAAPGRCGCHPGNTNRPGRPPPRRGRGSPVRPGSPGPAISAKSRRAGA